MELIAEEVDGQFYIDAILSANELLDLKELEMLMNQVLIKRRIYHVSVRLKGIWDEEEEQRAE